MNTEVIEALRMAMRKLGPFEPRHIEALAQRVAVRPLAKNQNLLQPGQVCQEAAYVHAGSLRLYHINDQAEAVTHRLFTAGDWALDAQSFIGQRKTNNYLQAYDASTLLVFNMHQVHELIASEPVYFTMGRLLEPGLDPMHGQLEGTTPEARYRTLLAKRPDYLQAFPLKHIASYLKITPETLSRVRRKLST